MQIETPVQVEIKIVPFEVGIFISLVMDCKKSLILVPQVRTVKSFLIVLKILR